MMNIEKTNFRKTAQYLMPFMKPETSPGHYDIYPAHPMGDGKIYSGTAQLADEMAGHPTVVIDGYQGVFFDELRQQLQLSFDEMGISVNWIDVSDALKPESDIEKTIAPFLGGDDPLFGSRTTLELPDFFDRERLLSFSPDPASDLNIVYGTGASLTGISGLLVYIDLPKNELQFRARAKSVTNLGAGVAGEIKPMYKRFYFVDWVVLNRHKQQLLPLIDIIADGQRPAQVTWAKGMISAADCTG
jgi:hypothetical protein